LGHIFIRSHRRDQPHQRPIRALARERIPEAEYDPFKLLLRSHKMKFHLTEEIWREAAREKKVSASGRFENQTAGEPDGETEWLKGGGRPSNSQVFYFLTRPQTH
jgi:hypothetical protein